MNRVNWKEYDYNKNKDCHVCRRCGFETKSIDESILHTREHLKQPK
mgnify:CR=1 FL=1